MLIQSFPHFQLFWVSLDKDGLGKKGRDDSDFTVPALSTEVRQISEIG